MGVWTLVEKSGYLSVLASSTFAASAYILIFAGALVMVTGFLGFGAIIREDRSCLSTVSAAAPCPALLRLGGGKRGGGGDSGSPPVPQPGSWTENPTKESGPAWSPRPQEGGGCAPLGLAVALSLGP